MNVGDRIRATNGPSVVYGTVASLWEGGKVWIRAEQATYCWCLGPGDGAWTIDLDEGQHPRCRRCRGVDDLMDVAMMPGFTFCKWCREFRWLEEQHGYLSNRLEALTAAIEGLA